MSKKYYDGDIPFTTTGDLVSYYSQWDLDNNRAILKPNFKFDAVMEITGYGRGRSSAVFYLDDVKTKKTYSIFMSDMLNILTTCHIENGVITKDGDYACEWTFCKKGANFGLQLVMD